MMAPLTSRQVTCPDCKNTFLQPFVCTTCGAQKLYDETVRSQAATIDRLTAEVAELRLDAERYRWLRHRLGVTIIRCRQEPVTTMPLVLVVPTSEDYAVEVDTAIDAALGEQP